MLLLPVKAKVMDPSATAPDPARRQFLRWFLGTSFGGLVVAALYPVLAFLRPPEIPEATTNQVEAGSVNDPDLVERGWKILRFGAEPVVLFKVGEGDYRALSATCTHLACIVEYQRDKQRIFCYCHNGIYDLRGKNIGGPPPRPLTPFRVDRVAKSKGQPDMLVVSRS